MDKTAIGKFITKCRKDRHITQEQLASMLNVTSKSVSKWENGICLPDASLYEPLCGILSISISELFAGHRLPDTCLLQMLKHRLYRLSGNRVPFSEFDNALTQIAALTAMLKTFDSKEDAVDHMMRETRASREECANAYDFYIHLFSEVSE